MSDAYYKHPRLEAPNKYGIRIQETFFILIHHNLLTLAWI